MKATRRHPLAGALLVLAGASIAVAVHSRPEALRAPTWVAFAAALAFALAGLSLLAQAWELPRRVQAWIAVLLVGVMLTPLAWIGTADSHGRCRANFLGVSVPAPDWVCRTGVALAAAVGLLMLAIALRHAWRGGSGR